jgi:tetratricopeptide (TPR) repeat protein
MQPVAAERPSGPGRTGLVALALAAATFAAFAPALGCGFIPLDDPQYVSQNPCVLGGPGAGATRWAFTTFHLCNWHPLTWLSLQLDAALWGADPRGFHLTNVLLHAANAALLFGALRALTGAFWRSAAVALLFGVHPLRVESVAWVSERKDVLSIFFGLAALRVYARYARAPSAPRYLAVFLALALSLMAKATLVTLPCLLLVLDWWPLGRARSGRDWSHLVAEKVPLLALAAAACVVTYLAQQEGGATRSREAFPAAVRVGNAAVACVTYLAKSAWPSGLAFFYPHPKGSLPAWRVAGASLLLAAVMASTAALRRRAPYLLAGWLWYLGTLVPVLGLVQVGEQAMADRYTYFPQVGVLVALSWGVADLAAGRGTLATLAAAAAALALATLTFGRLQLWRDPRALLEASLEVTGPNEVILSCLGRAYEDGRDDASAARCFREALATNPESALVLCNIGGLLARAGDLDEAARHLEKARDLAPGYAPVRVFLGGVYGRQDQPAAAAREYEEYCRLVPDSPHGYIELGKVYARQGDYERAARQFERACRLDPSSVEALLSLGRAEEERGNWASAAECYGGAARLCPGRPEALAGLGVALSRLGRRDEGLTQLRAAVARDPAFVHARVLLGQALANRGDFAGAAAHLEEAVRLDPSRRGAWHDLGLVRRLQGRTAEAAECFRRAGEAGPGPARPRDWTAE